MQSAALGFRPHTGWTAAVALAAPDGAPILLERRRIELVASDVRHVYHLAEELAQGATRPSRGARGGAAGDPLDPARTLVARVAAEANRSAATEIAAMVAALRERGARVTSVGIAASDAVLPDDLRAILASHARLHAAEGALYRDALARAGEELGLRVILSPARSLTAFAAAKLGRGPEALTAALTALGKGAGRPWAADQKESALAAWAALGA